MEIIRKEIRDFCSKHVKNVVKYPGLFDLSIEQIANEKANEIFRNLAPELAEKYEVVLGGTDGIVDIFDVVVTFERKTTAEPYWRLPEYGCTSFVNITGPVQITISDGSSSYTLFEEARVTNVDNED